MGPLAFEADQIEALRENGVIEPQIRRLTEILIPCRSAFEPMAPMAKVREEIGALGEALSHAEKGMSRLLRAHGRRLATQEARVRIQVASFERPDRRGAGDEIETALAAVKAAIVVTRRAFRSLPRAQRRARNASTIPPRLIYHALIGGWGEAYYPVWNGDETHMTDGPHPFCLPITSNPTGPFRTIVGICYDAFLNTSGSDPERAIKAFVTELKAEARRRAEIVNSAVSDT